MLFIYCLLYLRRREINRKPSVVFSLAVVQWTNWTPSAQSHGCMRVQSTSLNVFCILERVPGVFLWGMLQEYGVPDPQIQGDRSLLGPVSELGIPHRQLV